MTVINSFLKPQAENFLGDHRSGGCEYVEQKNVKLEVGLDSFISCVLVSQFTF